MIRVLILLLNMSGSVCNLFFFEPGTAITTATGPINPDGAVHVETLGDGTPKFVIYPSGSPTDPSYASRSNTSGTFTGLVPGTYIVNARTSDVCKKELTIVIDYVITWTPRFRIQHNTVEVTSGLQFRIDIEDNQYVGAVSYVTGQNEPDILTWINEAGDNVFEPVVGVDLELNLTSLTDGYFDVLNSYDEKRFRVTYYVKVSGVYVQKWQGFLIPQNSDEQYCLTSNYPISFMASDGLRDLENILFSDNSGNAPQVRMSVMQAIVFCTQKTGLQLQIWETVNIYESAMDHGSGDSTLSQLYFDPKVYQQDDGTMESCLSVLQSLLRNLGARLSQSDGVWMVDCPTLKTGSTTATRKFAADGGSISGSDIAYRIALRGNSGVNPKLLFEGCTARKSHQTMYGKISFTYDFGLDDKPSLLKNSDFEDEDIINGQLDSWQISYSGYTPPQVAAQIITDTSKEHDKVLKQAFHLDKGIAAQEQIVISSALVPMTLSDSQPTKLRISFDVYTAPSDKNTYVFLDVSLAMDDGSPIALSMNLAKNDDGSFQFATATTTGLGQYHRVYVDEHYTWKTIVIEAVYDSGIEVSGNIQLQLAVTNNPLYDYDSVTTLRTESETSVGKPDQNDRRRVYDATLSAVRHYKLVRSNAADDSDQYIRPFDYDLFLWQLDKIIYPNDASDESWLSYILLDNIQVQYLPNEEAPPESETTEITINANVRNTLDVVFRHGDLPTDTNYKNLMHGWFSLLDGTPTAEWFYRSGGSSYTLMGLLRNLYQGQYSVDRWKLSGSVLALGSLPFLGFPVHEVATGRIYVLVSSSIAAKQPTAIIEMIEALKGTPGEDPDVEPPVTIADFSAIDFSPIDFNAE